MTEARSGSILKRLSNISKEREVAYQFILTEFLIERMVIKLTSSTKLANVFVFKGGYVGRRAYGSPRYTIDLDALLRTGNQASLREELVSTIEKDNDDGTWHRFRQQIDLVTQGEYPGIRYAFRADIGEPLPNIRPHPRTKFALRMPIRIK